MNLKSLMLARKLGGGTSGGGSDADKYFEGGYEDVVLPNATKIKNYAFYYDSTLKNITMPNIKEIGKYAFGSCRDLALTSLPEGVTRINVGAFQDCYKLAPTSLPAGVTYVDSLAFQYCTGLTSLTFKGTPTTIANNAFSGCTNLATINVPWAEGEVKNAPWGATNATINYNYTGE